MGALDEGHFSVELEDGVNVEVGFEPETLPIEEAVKVLLQGLGEDINREGIRKTPARVAKALCEGTRGTISLCFFFPFICCFFLFLLLFCVGKFWDWDLVLFSA